LVLSTTLIIKYKAMELSGESFLLRIFIGELDKVNGTPLYEVIVYAAKRYGIAGATVLRGIMGYGANSVVHTEKLLTLSNDLPVVVELVDEEVKIKGFLESMQKFMPKSRFGALITLERVNVLHYEASKD